MEVIEKKGDAYERREHRFKRWLENVPKWHDHFVYSPNVNTQFTVPAKLLNASKVALVTSAGIHLKSQQPFDVFSEYGDWSYREIPADTLPEELMISDTHYDHSNADKDINCILPITHAQTLACEGFIGRVATNHYSFMGFIPNPKDLILKTAPEVANLLRKDGVDIVFLTPG